MSWWGLLPEGWTSEDQFDERYTVFTKPHPDGGFVTIDWQERVFRAGMVWAGRPTSTKTYAGLCWRQRIIKDAIGWLRETLK